MAASDKYYYYGLVDTGLVTNSAEKYWYYGLPDPIISGAIQSLAVLFSGSTTFSASLSLTKFLASTISGVGTLTCDLTQNFLIQLAATFSGSATFTTSIAKTTFLDVTFTGIGTFSPSLDQIILLSVTFIGISSLIAFIPFIITGRPTLNFTTFKNVTGINVAGPMPVAYIRRAFTYRNRMTPNIAAVPALTPDAYSGETGRDEDLSGTFS